MRHARGWSVLALGIAVAAVVAAGWLSRSHRRVVVMGSASSTIGTADSLQRAGRALENRDWTGARTCYENALAIRRALLGRRHIDVAASLEDVGIAYTQLAVFDSARVRLQEALALRQELLGPEHLDVAQTQMSLGQLYVKVGDYALARKAYEEALAIRQAAYGPHHVEISGVLNNLATLLMVTGENREAQALLERALAIRTQKLGPQHGLVASTLANLAVVHRDLGEMEAAKRYYERGLKIVESTDDPLLPTYLHGFGRFALDNGDEAAATIYLERAAAMRRRLLGIHHPSTAAVECDLALVHERAGDLTAARALLDSALIVKRGALPADHPELAETLVQRARVLNRCGDDTSAFESAIEGEGSARAHLQLTAQWLSERQALQYDAIRASGLDAAIAIAARTPKSEYVTKAWDALVRSRALILDEFASRQHVVAAAADDPRLEVTAMALRNARARVAALKVRSDPNPSRAREILEIALQDCDTAERHLAELCAPFRADLERTRVGLEMVRSGMPKGTTLVSFAVYDAAIEQPTFASRLGAHRIRSAATYAVFILHPDGNPRLIRLGSAAVIEPLVTEWVRAIRRGGAAQSASAITAAEVKCTEIGARLRTTIWDPIASEVEGSERIVIIPDGVLSLIDFYALPAWNGGYMIERDVILHTFAAERDLVARREAVPKGLGLLALGGPRFDDTPVAEMKTAGWRGSHPVSPGGNCDCQDLSTVRFEPLPASAREAEEVASLWRRGVPGGDEVRCLTGGDASEAAFVAAAPGRRVLHLATHGFFMDGECSEELPGTRALGRVHRTGSAPVAVCPRLGLAGLALAGANARGNAMGAENDGILTAEEIAGLDLRGVEVAVLSACDTGRGEIRAREGVLGLRRAFTVAGAQALVLSLWPVRDDLAREWMHHFHTRYLSGDVGTEVAARDAGRAVLLARRARGESGHPFAWAGFIAAGGYVGSVRK